MVICGLWGLLTGCQSPPHRTASPALKRFSFAELHMATRFGIVMYAPDEATANHAAETAFYEIARLEDLMTDYDPSSELMRLCRQPAGQPAAVSGDLFAVIQQAQRLAAQTDGAFDITVGPLVQLWRASRKNHSLPSAAARQAAQALVGWRKLKGDASHRTLTLGTDGMRLDLGGIAKGYAADRALSLLRNLGIRQAMVSAGGDIALGDPPPGQTGWLIAIESLDYNPGQTAPTLRLHNVGISTSGDTEQYVEIAGQRFSHIVSPFTGLGLTHRIAATVIAPNATTSDATATALCVMGLPHGLAFVQKQPRLAARFVSADSHGTQITESTRFQRLRNRGH